MIEFHNDGFFDAMKCICHPASLILTGFHQPDCPEYPTEGYNQPPATQTQAGSELLPCPFCGATPNSCLRQSHDEHGECEYAYHEIECGNKACGVYPLVCENLNADEGDKAWELAIDRAVTAWNTRTPDPAPAVARDEAEDPFNLQSQLDEALVAEYQRGYAAAMQEVRKATATPPAPEGRETPEPFRVELIEANSKLARCQRELAETMERLRTAEAERDGANKMHSAQLRVSHEWKTLYEGMGSRFGNDMAEWATAQQARANLVTKERDTARAEVRALQLKLEAVHSLYLGATADNVASALEIARLTKDRDLNRNTRLHDGEVAKQWAKDRDAARAEVARLKESRESFVRQLAASESALATATARIGNLEGALRKARSWWVTQPPKEVRDQVEAALLPTRDTVTPTPEEKP